MDMIQKYAAFSVEDFVGDERFIAWANAPEGQLQGWHNDIIAAYPSQEPVMKQARQIVIQLSQASAMPFQKEDADQIWDNIDNALLSQAPYRKLRPLYRTWWAAAAVLFMIGLGWSVYDKNGTDKAIGYHKLLREAKIPVQEIVNTGANTLVVKLPDGSRVFLAPDSKLSYARDFTRKTREVYLSGKAFFDVTKNPEKPFIVYANELVTKVLGTSFTIKALDKDPRVTVAVKTGRVSVFPNHQSNAVDPETKGIILIPNQQADFQRDNETISRSLVEHPKIVIAKKELDKFSFNNAPVSEIFDAMENAYGVDFLFDQEVLASCRITTSLSEETLFERLDVVCEAIGASYKVVDAQIVITGKKCN